MTRRYCLRCGHKYSSREHLLCQASPQPKSHETLRKYGVARGRGWPAWQRERMARAS